MEPHYINKALDPFQVCAFPGCGKDATEETEAPVDANLQYFVTACAEHGRDMSLVVSLLTSGKKPETIGRKKQVDVEELFVSPPGQSGKCRYAQWVAHKKEIHAPQATSTPPQKERKTHAVQDWTWPLNRDRWRTTEGTVVPLEHLRLAELVSAIFEIRAVNFPTIFPSIAWTKQLTLPEFIFTYPEEELAVGVKLAKQKLADMQEEALQRNLLR